MVLLFAGAAFFIFYILLPFLGGLQVKGNWRRFREIVMKSTLHPEIKYPRFDGDGPLGPHRLLGQIEAIQGKNLLWVKGEGATVCADMTKAEVYFLPPPSKEELRPQDFMKKDFPEEIPQRRTWRQVTSLPEGTQIYLIGLLEQKEGRLFFGGTRETPLLGILHDGKFVVPRSVWSGRQKNEYWNLITPWSLLLGSLILFILATTTFRSPFSRQTFYWLLAGALAPLVPFMPPGILFFLAYLSSWRWGRLLRAERDLLSMAAFLRTNSKDQEFKEWEEGMPRDTAPLIQSCRRKSLAAELTAALTFLLGFVLNYILLLILLANLV